MVSVILDELAGVDGYTLDLLLQILKNLKVASGLSNKKSSKGNFQSLKFISC